MIEAVMRVLEEKGVRAEDIFYDKFWPGAPARCFRRSLRSLR